MELTPEIKSMIERIAEEHSGQKKVFGYLDKDDLKSEIWVICLSVLKDYDETRGVLERFLRVSVRNRLVNKFKDITKSVRSPCPRCPFFREGKTPDCKKFKLEKERCDKWRNYKLSTDSRNSLLNASDHQVERDIGDNSITKMISDETKQTILDNINNEFLNDFNTMLNNGKLSKKRLRRLQEEIFNILGTKEL